MQPDFDLCARVLFDAETLGDRYAAKRHKVSERTVGRYRANFGAHPDVLSRIAILRDQVNGGWIQSARAARMHMVERVAEIAEAKNTSLDSATEALRRIHEVVMSHELVGPSPANDSTPKSDAQRSEPHQSKDPPEAQGAGAGAGAGARPRGPTDPDPSAH